MRKQYNINVKDHIIITIKGVGSVGEIPNAHIFSYCPLILTYLAV